MMVVCHSDMQVAVRDAEHIRQLLEGLGAVEGVLGVERGMGPLEFDWGDGEEGGGYVDGGLATPGSSVPLDAQTQAEGPPMSMARVKRRRKPSASEAAPP